MSLVFFQQTFSSLPNLLLLFKESSLHILGNILVHFRTFSTFRTFQYIFQGISWRSSGWDSTLSLPRAWVQSLVRELGSHKLLMAGDAQLSTGLSCFFPGLSASFALATLSPPDQAAPGSKGNILSNIFNSYHLPMS